jgi:hypothetical protein
MRRQSVFSVASKSHMWCECQKPSFGECTSSGLSEYMWWRRWCAAHQRAPFCALVCARNASTNCIGRLVLYVRCEKYRW